MRVIVYLGRYDPRVPSAHPMFHPRTPCSIRAPHVPSAHPMFHPRTPCSIRHRPSGYGGFHKGLGYVIATAIGVLWFARYPMFHPPRPSGYGGLHKGLGYVIATAIGDYCGSPVTPCSIRHRPSGYGGLHKGLGYVVATAIGFVVRPLPHVPSAIALRATADSTRG